MHCEGQSALLQPLTQWRRRDTAGQERYHSLAPMYYRGAWHSPGMNLTGGVDCSTAGAAAAIIVYDITNSDSFARAKSWVRPSLPADMFVPLSGALLVKVRELQRQGNASLVMALTGNKADLADKRKVEVEVRLIAMRGLLRWLMQTVVLVRRHKHMLKRTTCTSWRRLQRLRQTSTVRIRRSGSVPVTAFMPLLSH